MTAAVVVGCVVVTLGLTTPVLVASAALEAAHRAAAAADGAALAAADALGGWVEAEPCALAAQVVHAVEAGTLRCALEQETGQVRVSVSVQTMLGTVEAHARAGPLVP